LLRKNLFTRFARNKNKIKVLIKLLIGSKSLSSSEQILYLIQSGPVNGLVGIFLLTCLCFNICATIIYMKIGIDARIINDYVKSLLKTLLKRDKRNHYVLFFDSRVPKEKAEKYQGANIKIKYFPFSRYRKFISYAYSQILVSAFLVKERLDIFHAASGTMPLIYPGRTILNIWQIEKKLAAKVLQNKICKKAKKIIVDSEKLRRQLIRIYKIKPEKIIVLKKPKSKEILRLYRNKL